MNSRTWPSFNTCPIGMQHNARTSKPGELTMAKKLEKSMWRPYFDDISKVLAGKRAEIEVAALNLGDQIEVEWAAFDRHQFTIRRMTSSKSRSKGSIT